MNVSDLLVKRFYLKIKIENLIDHLNSNVTHEKKDANHINKVVELLLSCLDEHQKYLILLDESNNKTYIKAGTSDVLISAAVRVRETMKNKIELLSSLISIEASSLNLFNLIDQRDKLIEEYVMLSERISNSDKETKID